MSEKKRDNEGRAAEGQTEEPIQDPSSDDFEAHAHGERGRDDASGLPNRDSEGDRHRDSEGERLRDSEG